MMSANRIAGQQNVIGPSFGQGNKVGLEDFENRRPVFDFPICSKAARAG